MIQHPFNTQYSSIKDDLPRQSADCRNTKGETQIRTTNALYQIQTNNTDNKISSLQTGRAMNNMNCMAVGWDDSN